MNQTHRSSSPPAPGHASPPLSPTVVSMCSRSPTPSPTRENASGFHRAKRSYSVSRISDLRAATKDLRIYKTQEAVLSPSLPHSCSKAASPEKTNRRPLVLDAAQYVEKDSAQWTFGSPSTSLEELAHLARLSTYQERKRQQSRIRLHRSLVSTALSARLARCGELAHRTLAENFRTDQKKDFVTLYNALHDVRNSCDASRRYALLDPDLDVGRSSPDTEVDTRSFSTFMHELPAQACDTILLFLTQIRTNPDFLASRLSSLGAAELAALTSFHQGLEPIESVLPFHTRPKGPASSSHRNSALIPTPVERLLSFQRHDPLSALIHSCFANSAGPDSAEDLRRTDIWAAACARLISENKSGTDPFICSVLNVWTAMRDWSGKNSLEWYLMKILNDGAFLLEKAEDQAGTRIHVEPRNAKDSIAADEFYDGAVKSLFEVIDDPGAGGIPEGLLELGNAILRKLDDPKRHRPAQNFLVSKYLFSLFLLNAIIHPECCGMMLGYHITEYARQKILKAVALGAQKLIVDMTWKQSTSTPPEIRVHIENIMSKFHSARRPRTAKLLPARSITSLRETAEVHPYLVLSPADMATMVNALYPERRPTSSASLEKDLHVHGMRSGASSVSGRSAISNMMSMQQLSSRNTFDTMSVISNSDSVFSDQTSKEPLLFEESFYGGNLFSSASMSSLSQRASSYEDEGYKLRLALHEMSRLLGPEAVAGTCHPCAEKWAVIFLSPNGEELSIRMRHDVLSEDSNDDNSSDSETDTDDTNPSGVGLDKEYHQLRDAILKLLEDYEIPRSPDTVDSARKLSNRPSTLRTPRKSHRPKLKVQMFDPPKQSKNPYRQRGRSPSSGDSQNTKTSRSKSVRRIHSEERRTKLIEEPYPALLAMLEAAEKQCQAQSDFINAHLYWKTLQSLRHMSSPTLKQNGFASLLNIFSRSPRDSITQSAAAIEEYDAWLVWLKQSQERHDVSIEGMMLRLKALRDKMWYANDVKNSAAYETARNIAVALKSMASPRNRRNSSGTRPRNITRNMATSFLLKTESQYMDLIAAPDEFGGPNKLTDEQSEITLRWLSQGSIENFCKGEERIHRFALEIDSCIGKLIGDSLMDGPVLWSSELYLRDKRILDEGRQKGDLFVNDMGSLSISSEEGRDGNRSMRNHDFAPTQRRSHRDLRSISARNHSQQSFDSSGRWSASRGTTVIDYMDSPDYFGVSSPVLTIDSSSTFWSPFQTRSQSPTTSISSARPLANSASNDTLMLKSSENARNTRQRFLLELKQTLTSLLISDLGTLVFSKGSETDAWFSGDLGQECMGRREPQDVKVLCRHKRRVIEKKRSFRDLRSANNPDQQPSPAEFNEALEKGSQGTSRASTDCTERSEATSVKDTPKASRRTQAKEAEDFPYAASFRRLLEMFSVHPNPFIKLNALHELEQLIIASLTLKRVRPRNKRQDTLPSPSRPDMADMYDMPSAFDAPATPARARNLDEAIGNCRERRSQSISTNLASPSTPKFMSAFESPSNTRDRGAKMPSTDDIVEEIQSLLRKAEIRPKTLFRDLQFVAAFVPAHILDGTPRGKAFWDTVLAALGLKQDVVKSMIEIADEVVEYYTKNRAPGSSYGISPQPHTSTSENTPSERSGSSSNVAGSPNQKYMKYSLEDAGRMWTITAKEGDTVAERELAIFYLTHPELLPEKTTLPLSRPSLNFKQLHEGGSGRWNAMTKGKSDGERGDGGRDGKSDMAAMCLAKHWMEASAIGGDALARTYLRQREELEAIP